ncbi:DUF512 domain-containing protein [Halanaerobium salsuginis]|uniref:4Fe-4S single cluster domain-containing protein n=1 Tax=Halanaerobium salsuginis TaxID=29563 RepID=A0A1I4H6Z3_9FIRM|nr:DUF512 domain-containing protein [Halanaerobium salsuginis]SFL38058.1 4Fe-4S single cluster domain-containing protein [Halanaerobium salsuginis]
MKNKKTGSRERTREEILLKTVQNDNILPITSICKLNCIFCSHKNNHHSIKSYSFGHLEFELIKTMIEFLDPEQPVYIGESASKIIEGEPFAHPKIWQILKELRKRWPNLEIKITTSGSFLTPDRVSQLAELGPLALNISLNAPAPAERVFLMNDSRPDNVFKLIKKLTEHKLQFEASIVSMHHLKGLDYLKEVFDFLADYPPQVLRVFLAGFSIYADPDLLVDKAAYQQLNSFIKKEQFNYNYPIIIEPQLLTDLQVEVCGIISNSPADSSGLIAGDIIQTINNKEVSTRVESFYKLQKLANPELLIRRKKQEFKLILKKNAAEKSGLIMSYDFELEQLNKLLAYAEAAKTTGENIATLVITSSLAYPLLNSILAEYLGDDNFNLDLIKTENKFFGGSIKAAGLLVNSDIEFAVNNYLIQPDHQKINRIILPAVIYDYYGDDLLGCNYSQLADQLSAEIILL